MITKLKRSIKEKSTIIHNFFETQDSSILDTNIHVFKIISIISFIALFFILLIAHFTLKSFTMTLYYHILLLILAFQIFVAFCINKKRLKNKTMERLILIIFCNILYIFLISIDTVSSPHNTQIFASSFLVVAPTIFIMKPSRMFCDQIYFIVFYIIMAINFKDPNIVVTDIYSILLGFIYGCVSYFITLELRIKANGEVIKFKTVSEIDELSGLNNRRAANDQINQYLTHRPLQDKCALFIIDIDLFKTINDTFGHPKGDFVIKGVSNVLSQSFRKRDIIARYGGDEFIVFINGINNDDIIHTKCQKINKDVQTILSDEYTVTCSIGVCFVDVPDVTYEQIFEKADQALYHTKESAKGTYTINKL